MALLSELNGIKPSSRTFRESKRLPLPRGVVGIEVELENVPRYNMPKVDKEYWDVDRDDSLRNNGVEFISKPLFGMDLLAGLDSLATSISGMQPEITNRCGLHIHLDVSGFNTDELLGLCCIVGLAEPALYEYVGIARKDNIYCLPISSTDNILPYLNSIKYGRDNAAVAKAIQSSQKYSGFNILPIMSQGSVEFRHHAGTADMGRVLEWIRILQQLVKIATIFSPQELLAKGREEINQILFSTSEVSLTEEQYIEGYLVAKDILNFNKLGDVWESSVDVYFDEDNFNWD